jgi:hypothetical protein
VALLIAAATPASGQIVTPGVAPASSATQSAVTTPDFSGIWVKPYLGIESPLSGPGPVVNKFRRRQIFDIDGRYCTVQIDRRSVAIRAGSSFVIANHGFLKF